MLTATKDSTCTMPIAKSTSSNFLRRQVPEALGYAALAVFGWIVMQPLGGLIGTISGLILILLIVCSTATDLKARKIHNSLTYSLLIAALALNLLASILPDQLEVGTIGIASSLAGTIICFFVMLFPYGMAGGGAGDVKLATVLGALLGPQVALFAIAVSYACAGMGIIVVAAYRKGLLNLVMALLRSAGAKLLPAYVLPPNEQQRALVMQPVPLAPFFAMGTLLTVLGGIS